jgi:hypothetical protein
MDEFDAVFGVGKERASSLAKSPKKDSSYYKNRYMAMLTDNNSLKDRHTTIQDVLDADKPPKRQRKIQSPPKSLSPQVTPIKRQRTELKKSPSKVTLMSASSAALILLKQDFGHKSLQELLKSLNVSIPTRLMKGSRKSHIKFTGLTLVGDLCEELVSALEQLILQGANPYFRDSDENFPLSLLLHYRNCSSIVLDWVSRQQHSELVTDLRWQGFSLSDLAITLGHCEILVRLLELGIMPSVKTKFEPAERFLRIHGHHCEGVKLLREAFWSALENQDVQTLEDLVCHLDQINFQDSAGKTPLFVAVEKTTSAEIVKLLLEHGADPNIPDSNDTPMIVFPLMRSRTSAVVKMLLEHHADIERHVDATGQTILQFAEDAAVSPSTLELLRNHLSASQ